MTTTQEAIVAGIAEIIEEVTGIEADEVTMEKSFVEELEIDSLSLVEIAVQLEDKYDVKIPDEDLSSADGRRRGRLRAEDGGRTPAPRRGDGGRTPRTPRRLTGTARTGAGAGDLAPTPRLPEAGAREAV
ncbi:hypothetical protein NN3_52260 [Nocardia neocaledoniensis NBRC 108232]|uniref:Acyl carrier protein n=1 Tax=Nocardia neocaledoniensis TaxID=236511 RepID=A0A317N2A9_9NOCA|nr:acyl carrier protein [Nocardia neocaledoniensis]GEM34219.1 hypothetical protein NN3_52260 [Nocardia neocaledoniensis NBRC 108232]